MTSDDATNSIRKWFRDHGLAALYNLNRSALTVPPLGPGDVITVIDGVLSITPG